MSFESPHRQAPLTLDEVLANLDSGEIQAGHEIAEITLVHPAGRKITGRFNQTEHILSYSDNGVAVKAEIKNDGSLGYFSVTDSVTNTSVKGSDLHTHHRKIIEDFLANRQI